MKTVNRLFIVFLLALIFCQKPYAKLDPENLCGSDDRIPSNNLAVGRIILTYQSNTAATGFIIPNGKIVSAGHVHDHLIEGDWIEFNVKPSSSDGMIQYSEDEDRYLINIGSVQYSRSADGDDWMVFSVYPNSITGLTPIEAQQAFFLCNDSYGASTIRITGYGTDDGTANRTQQTALGSYSGYQSPNFHKYITDSETGNSGSPIIDKQQDLL